MDLAHLYSTHQCQKLELRVEQALLAGEEVGLMDRGYNREQES